MLFRATSARPMAFELVEKRKTPLQVASRCTRAETSFGIELHERTRREFLDELVDAHVPGLGEPFETLMCDVRHSDGQCSHDFIRLTVPPAKWILDRIQNDGGHNRDRPVEAARKRDRSGVEPLRCRTNYRGASLYVAVAGLLVWLE
jgi:hypothetical protein